MREGSYLIHELAEKAGVSLRTIRFYIEKGLLPEAPIKGRYAAYSDEYVDRIRLILQLKHNHVPLDEIREQTAHLTAQEVREKLIKGASRHEKDLFKQGMDQQDVLPGLDEVNAVKGYLNGEDDEQAGARARKSTLFNGMVWERVTVAKGIELHFRRPVDSRQLRKLQEIIDFAKRKLRDEGQED